MLHMVARYVACWKLYVLCCVSGEDSFSVFSIYIFFRDVTDYWASCLPAWLTCCLAALLLSPMTDLQIVVAVIIAVVALGLMVLAWLGFVWIAVGLLSLQLPWKITFQPTFVVVGIFRKKNKLREKMKCCACGYLLPYRNALPHHSQATNQSTFPPTTALHHRRCRSCNVSSAQWAQPQWQPAQKEWLWVLGWLCEWIVFVNFWWVVLWCFFSSCCCTVQKWKKVWE